MSTPSQLLQNYLKYSTCSHFHNSRKVFLVQSPEFQSSLSKSPKEFIECFKSESRKSRFRPESLLVDHASSFEVGIIAVLERGGGTCEEAVFFSRQKGNFVKTTDHQLHVVRAHVLRRDAGFECPWRVFCHYVG